MNTIEYAKQAVRSILEREDCLSDDVMEIIDKYLFDYGIDSKQLRMQIIQDAAIDVGLLHAGDVD